MQSIDDVYISLICMSLNYVHPNIHLYTNIPPFSRLGRKASRFVNTTVVTGTIGDGPTGTSTPLGTVMTGSSSSVKLEPDTCLLPTVTSVPAVLASTKRTSKTEGNPDNNNQYTTISLQANTQYKSCGLYFATVTCVT